MSALFKIILPFFYPRCPRVLLSLERRRLRDTPWRLVSRYRCHRRSFSHLALTIGQCRCRQEPIAPSPPPALARVHPPWPTCLQRGIISATSFPNIFLPTTHRSQLL